MNRKRREGESYEDYRAALAKPVVRPTKWLIKHPPMDEVRTPYRKP